ncbi:MAG: SEC-C metal-binding domain-containing protein, partial [Betaproteobacteria bacterium]
SPEQDDLTRTPAHRAELALQIPEAVLAMHAHWLPLRQAVHESNVAQALRTKVGRNEPCPCGSGKKIKKCCGSPADLH